MNYAVKYPRFWLSYLWVSFALLVATYVAAAVNAFAGKATLADASGLAMSSLAMWPLYGYVRQRRIAPRWLWRVVLVLSGIALVTVTVLTAFLSLKTNAWRVLLVPIGVWLVVGPQLFGLYQYINHSPHIWSASDA